MTTNPYQVLGSSIPPMLGRAELLRRIEQHLLKPQPEHVSVVGPKHYGKSVLLRHLAGIHRTEPAGFLTTAYIDLRNDTPDSDRSFMTRLAKDLKAALDPVRPDLSEYIDLEDEAIYEVLDDILGDIKESGARILAVLDRFDVIARTEFTSTLLSQIRALAQIGSLILVAGSRRPLSDLGRTEESRTSDLWGIFHDSPVRVTALDDADWLDFLRPLEDAGCKVEESARKEVANWTGGVPVLVCALLRSVWDECRETRVAKPEIDRAAEMMLEGRSQLLPDLWDDADVETRGDLSKLSKGVIPRAELSDSRRRTLEDRGFGRMSGSHFRGTCGLMKCYAKAQAPAVENMARLFGTVAGFENNIRSMLELRLKQVGQNADPVLHDYVRRAVTEIDTPELAINGIRGIVERGLSLIWQAELPSDETLPEEWLDEWKHAGLMNLPEDRGRLPRGSGRKCSVLRLITGTDSTRRLSRYVTKTTYLLVDHLQSVGHLGQHRSDSPEAKVTMGFAAGVVLSAISLVESLTADLSRTEDTAS